MNKTNIKIILNNDEEIKLTLDPSFAPKTVENFLKLVNDKFYDGTIFHRVIDNFMIQTGGYFLDGNQIYNKECGPIIGEFRANGIKNDLKHELGVISMARTSDMNSASSQFFICSTSCPHLDGSYAAFGYCDDDKSKEVIKKIASHPTTRVANYFDDFPTEIISIKTIEVEE